MSRSFAVIIHRRSLKQTSGVVFQNWVASWKYMPWRMNFTPSFLVEVVHALKIQQCHHWCTTLREFSALKLFWLIPKKNKHYFLKRNIVNHKKSRHNFWTKIPKSKGKSVIICNIFFSNLATYLDNMWLLKIVF